MEEVVITIEITRSWAYLLYGALCGASVMGTAWFFWSVRN